ncbi:MAG TPA: type II secretion system protein [Rickettsiales bacterium]|nr:type II secretion system protein [Rickettsiales bacterium]
MAKHTGTSGFTLIELSIVLVIIGLIVGGVLTGQNLIQSAAIRAQIAQIEKFNVAVNAFDNKYGAIPGDMGLTNASNFGFTTTGCTGGEGSRDGSGVIEGYFGGVRILEYGEATLFWSDLSQAGLIEGAFPTGNSYSSGCGITASNWTLTSGATYIGNYLPAAKIGNGNFIYVYDSDTYEGGIDSNNWYGLSAVNSVHTDGSMVSTPALSVLTAYRLDQKMDDGKPVTGSVQALFITSYWINQPNAQASDSATSCYNTTSGTYSVGINGGNGVNCAISFRLQ